MVQYQGVPLSGDILLKAHLTYEFFREDHGVELRDAWIVYTSNGAGELTVYEIMGTQDWMFAVQHIWISSHDPRTFQYFTKDVRIFVKYADVYNPNERSFIVNVFLEKLAVPIDITDIEEISSSEEEDDDEDV